MHVSIRELKNNLSKYIRLAQSGEVVLIQRHKKTVAELVPVIHSADEELDKLADIPGISWNGKKPQGGRLRPRIEGKSAAEYVLEDRE